MKDIFPSQVNEILRSLSQAGFFRYSLLAGSWTFLVYKELHGIQYVLRTGDIDFVLNTASKFIRPRDIEQVFLDRGYIVLRDYATGLRKYTKENFEIEFLVPRKGNKELDKLDIKELNIAASPLPFLDILFCNYEVVTIDDYTISIPCMEAMFLHKLIISNRRRNESKAERDLEQCRILCEVVDPAKLQAIAEQFKFSRKTQEMIIRSCKKITFPPHNVLTS